MRLPNANSHLDGWLWYGSPMEFTDYMIWKAIALVAAAVVWGIYCGFTGRSLQPGRREADTAEARSSED